MKKTYLLFYASELINVRERCSIPLAQHFVRAAANGAVFSDTGTTHSKIWFGQQHVSEPDDV